MDMTSDTIAAIATPLGQGGVGIVRMSGPEALTIITRFFRPSRDGFTKFRPYTLHHGWMHDQREKPLDEVLVSYMPAPGSFTGEDVVEVNCHGGPALLQTVLETLLDAGARAAQPGEFTKRAFCNNRLDLSQAEAVAEMIAAPTRAAAGLAASKLRGGLGRKVTRLTERLKSLRVQLTVAVDFPEDEVECLPRQEIKALVTETADAIKGLLVNYRRDRYWRDGVLAVLAGRVNAGKSSLMNCMLGRERAIVTPVPGTTRDYLEEFINLDGLPVKLVDTAGLRKSEDEVELAGLRLGKELATQADMVLLVVDQTVPLQTEELELAQEFGPDKVVVVLNKMDLATNHGLDGRDLNARGFEVCAISAKTGQGVDRLIQAIRQRIVGNRKEPAQDELVPNLRQSGLLKGALAELRGLSRDVEDGVPYDLMSVRLELACTHLAEITGTISPDHVLDRIFDRFCIGK